MGLFPTYSEKNLSLFEHLDELRTRLIRCVLALVLGFLVGYGFSGWAVDFLLQPIRDSGLVAQNQVVADVEVQPDGTWRFVRVEPVGAKAAEEADWVTSPTLAFELGGPLSIQRLEFFQPGDLLPVAVFLSSSPSGVVYIRPMDPFLIRLKAALILGVLFALPVILYQIYAFVAPGLLPRERQAIVPLFGGALLLFPIGAAFAYFLLKFAILFFATFAAEQTYLYNDIREYMSLALTTMLVFGVLFELPVAVLLLTRLGIISVETLAAKRKIIFVLLLVVAAAATPTGDPFTMSAMALPLYGLFEISLLIGRVSQRRRQESEQALADET